MSDETPQAGGRPPLTDEDRRIRLALAMALWAGETRDEMEGKDAAGRREAFNAVRADYVKKASRIFNQLRRRGVTMAMGESAGAEADAEGFGSYDD